MMIEPLLGIVLSVTLLVLVPYLVLNLAWNLFLVLGRSLAPVVSFAQARPIKWVRVGFRWIVPWSLLALMASVVAIPNLGSGCGHSRNSGVQANAHSIQMALEQYAQEHDGRFPESLRGLFPKYLLGYPITPWNTRQEASADVPAGSIASFAASRRTMLGRGVAENPRVITDFGAIGYTRIGTSGRHYLLSGTGRIGDNAAIVYFVSNVDEGQP